MELISERKRFSEQQQARMLLLLSRKLSTYPSTEIGEGDRTISAEFPTQTLILEQETSALQAAAPLEVILRDDALDISLPEEIITPNAEQPRANTAPEIANVQEKHTANETMPQDLEIRTAALSHTTFPNAGTGERDNSMSTTFPENLPLAGRETFTQAAAQLEVMIPDAALVALLPSGIIPLNGESPSASVITDAALDLQQPWFQPDYRLPYRMRHGQLILCRLPDEQLPPSSRK